MTLKVLHVWRALDVFGHASMERLVQDTHSTKIQTYSKKESEWVTLLTYSNPPPPHIKELARLAKELVKA